MEPNTDPTAEEIKAEPLLQLFRHMHLHEGTLRNISREFCGLAKSLTASVPRNAERSVMLRKLRESKDCAIAAVLWVTP